MEKEIEKELMKLGFKISNIGFRYWIRMLEIEEKEYSISEMYDIIAKEEKCAIGAIERALRTARKTATNKIIEKTNYGGKLTNKIVLELLRIILREKNVETTK